MRQILHVDMDAFFASVEQRDNPRLRGKPVVVGGSARRGVVAAASYEAREYGLRSAMSMAEALRRCPHAIVVPPRGNRYADVSDQIFAVFHRYTPLVEGLSIDEAFLDVTASQSLFGDGAAIARAIKNGVWEATGLTASAGVAPCKFAAKIASDLDKPDGLTCVGKDVAGFLAPLPVERMWGIGPKTAPELRRLGYHTLGSLAAASPDALKKVLGAWGAEIVHLARGDDPRPVEPHRDAKSIGAESTYDVDLEGREAIAKSLLRHASQVAERLVDAGISAGRVMVKLKYADFTLLTRSLTLAEPASDTRTLHEAALSLLERFPLSGARIRLTGLAAYDLGLPDPAQTVLFPDPTGARRRVIESVRARARERFGGHSLTFATLLETGAPRVAPEGNLEAFRPKK